jgi:hypothetical protein
MAYRYIFVAACLVSLPACQSKAVDLGKIKEVATSAQELAVRDTLTAQVKAAIDAEDFALLNRLEREHLTSRARTPSGVWLLGIYHAVLQFQLADGLVKADGCDYRKAAFVSRWAASDPTSPGPKITHAYLLQQQAWCYRGSGSATSVSEGNWAKFYQGLEASNAFMEANKAIAAKDPEFYAVQLTTYRGLNATDEIFRDLLTEAIDKEPDYHRTYFNAAQNYMPQWGGSYEQVDAFARFAAERTKRSEGLGMYARVIWWLDSCNCKVIENVADWPMMKEAMRDVYARNPVGWNRDFFIKASCVLKQPQEAADYIKVGNPNMDTNALLTAVTTQCQSAEARR